MRRAALSDLTNSKSAVTAEMALRLEKAFGVSMDLLLRMQAGYEAAQIRGRTAEIDVYRHRPDLLQRSTDSVSLTRRSRSWSANARRSSPTAWRETATGFLSEES